MSAVVTTVWLALLAGVAVLELVGRRRPGVASPSRIAGWIGASLPGRLLLVAVWAYVGWHLFARYGAPPR